MDIILLVTGIIVVVEMCILEITRRYDKFNGALSPMEKY